MAGSERTGASPGSKLPATFGKYSILGHLATGGMAEVYLARQAGLHGFEKIVVIKRVRPELTQDPEATQFFLDEARLVATLEHPNIAQVYEIGLVNDSYFFVMEYVHGADLRQLMEAAVTKRVKISLADSVYIMIGVCAALHYAHEKRDRDGRPLSIIHRDVSPSNVLISHDGAIKVCDFGIAKADNRTGAETTRGVLKGKFAYMSPEQCRSMKLDRRSDVFSIGTLLYELSTLSRLFIANSDFDLLRSVIEEPAPPPSSRTRNYSPELEQIVLKALAKNPDDRYPTAQAMQLELEAFAREHKLAMSPVNIAALMGQLFEKRIDAWRRAESEGHELAEYLLDTAVEKKEDDLPVFLPVGTNETTDPIDIEETGVHPRSQNVEMVTAPPRSARRATTAKVTPRGKPKLVWLAAAVAASSAAIALTFAATAPATSDHASFDADARRLAAGLDDAARNAQQRADSIASAPIVSAAIVTDAPTVRDMVKSENTLFNVLSPKQGETTSLYQGHGADAKLLVRLPATGPPLPVLTGRATKLISDGASLVVVASAPVRGPVSAGDDGVFEAASPVDLGFAKTALTGVVARATLTGLGPDLTLVTTPNPIGERIDIALPGDRGAHLLVTPFVQPSGSSWIGPARIVAFALALVAFAVWVAGFRRVRDATVLAR